MQNATCSGFLRVTWFLGESWILFMLGKLQVVTLGSEFIAAMTKYVGYFSAPKSNILFQYNNNIERGRKRRLYKVTVIKFLSAVLKQT